MVIDFKSVMWRRIHLPPMTKKEQKQLIELVESNDEPTLEEFIEGFDSKGLEHEDLLDTSRTMSLEENDFQCTIELFQDKHEQKTLATNLE